MLTCTFQAIGIALFCVFSPFYFSSHTRLSLAGSIHLAAAAPAGAPPLPAAGARRRLPPHCHHRGGGRGRSTAVEAGAAALNQKVPPALTLPPKIGWLARVAQPARGRRHTSPSAHERRADPKNDAWAPQTPEEPPARVSHSLREACWRECAVSRLQALKWRLLTTQDVTRPKKKTHAVPT